jgi:pimeloyl-ACP methyl ester carboxylesterase
LFIGRNQFDADGVLRGYLLADLRRRGFDVLVYEAPNEVAHRWLHSRFTRVPFWPRRLMKGLLLLVQPGLWRHAMPASKRLYATMEFRRRSVAAAIISLGNAPMVVARSVGARIASSLADELGLKGLVCLGYPFKHPNHENEPDRYAHLAGLRTPCLILQGEADAYGGVEIADVYALSPSIQLEFVPGDHAMRLPKSEMRTLCDQIAEFAARLI